MNNKIQQTIFFLFALLLAVFFVVIVLKDIDFKNVYSILKDVNYFWIILSMVISIFTYWLRALRWNLLLATMDYSPKISSSFWAISFSYFMGLVIPRSGEVVRSTSLYKMEHIPFDKSFGSIVLERIVDLVFLFFFFILTLLFNYETLLHFFNLSSKENLPSIQSSEESFAIYYYITTISILLFSLLFLIYIFRKKIVQFKFFKKVMNFIYGVLEGMQSIFKLERKALFILYSFSIWICYFFMSYVVFFAFSATKNFGIAEGLFLLIASSLGMMLPVSGGLAYPYIMSVAFSAIYITKGGSETEGRTIGDYFGLILYIAQIVSIIIFGLIAIYKISKNNKVLVK